MRKRDTAKSEIDSQRELLDSLMGINRNNDREDDQISDFRDERVCKFFITGMCPHDIFVNTKMDEGPCPKAHSEPLKAAFEKSKDLYLYDNLLEREFTSRIAEAERSIKRARQKLEEDKAEDTSNPDMNPDIIRIHTEMSKIIIEAEKAGEEGNIDRAQELILTKLEDLQKEKSAIISRLTDQRKELMRRTGVDTYKKLRVCDVCGSFLSIFDSDKRLQDHFLGKQHIGFQYMRDAVDAIKARRETKRLKDKDRDGGAGGINIPSSTTNNNAVGSSNSNNMSGNNNNSNSRTKRDGSRERESDGNRSRYREREFDRKQRDGSRDRGSNNDRDQYRGDRDRDRGGGGGGGGGRDRDYRDRDRYRY